jgi:hypothetical protein
LNPISPIPKDNIYDVHQFHHPVFDQAAIDGQFEPYNHMQGYRKIYGSVEHIYVMDFMRMEYGVLRKYLKKLIKSDHILNYSSLVKMKIFHKRHTPRNV